MIFLISITSGLGGHGPWIELFQFGTGIAHIVLTYVVAHVFSSIVTPLYIIKWVIWVGLVPLIELCRAGA